MERRLQPKRFICPRDVVEGTTPNRDPDCTAYFRGSFLSLDKRSGGKLMASGVITRGPRIQCKKARPREQGS